MRGEYCVGLARQYLHPNGSAVSVPYYFFDDINCKTNNNYRFGFICEKPLQKGDQPARRQAEGKFLLILPFFSWYSFSEACLWHSSCQNFKKFFKTLFLSRNSIFFNCLISVNFWQALLSCNASCSNHSPFLNWDSHFSVLRHASVTRAVTLTTAKVPGVGWTWNMIGLDTVPYLNVNLLAQLQQCPSTKVQILLWLIFFLIITFHPLNIYLLVFYLKIDNALLFVLFSLSKKTRLLYWEWWVI